VIIDRLQDEPRAALRDESVPDWRAAPRSSRSKVVAQAFAATGSARHYRSAAARAADIPVYYYVYDLLHLEGHATTELPLSWRKRLLRDALRFEDPLRYTTHRVEAGEAAHRTACQRGDEGVIAKLADVQYEGRPSANWLKFECARDQEFVIGGYTAPRGSRVGLGALLVGYHDGRDLVYAGKVGRFRRHHVAPPARADGAHRAGLAAVHPRTHAGGARPMGSPRARRAGRVHGMDAGRQAAPPALHRSAQRQEHSRCSAGSAVREHRRCAASRRAREAT
jgi:hypothetical protein